MSRRMSWILTVALTVLGSSGCGLFCDRYCERNHCDHQHDRCGCGSTNYAPPANNCCPSPGVYTAQPQPQAQCYP
jgi:hypothetical protein